MRRGVLLLATGVMVGCWLLAPATPASSETALPASAVQRTSTTLPVATTVTETTPTTTETVETVADTPSTAEAPTTVAAASDAATRDDPAATRLRRITYALVGLGGLVLVLNLVFWKVTRPALLLPTRDETTGKRSRREVPAAPELAGASGAALAGAVPAAVGGAPAKIPASAFLATAPGAAAPALPLPLAGQSAPTVGLAVPEVPGAAEPALVAVPGEEPPPQGDPAIDAPAPLADIPLGAPKPLVGADSAWIIEPESGSGLIPDTPTAVDFPDAGPVTAVAEVSAEPIEVSSTEVRADHRDPGPTAAASATPSAGPAAADLRAAPEPSYPAATQALISALSAIPDKEPTIVRFDDPPVERVARRRPAPAEPVEPVERTGRAPTAAPKGAPGFDRIAKETTATHAALPERQVDDMALMASALSSLPPRRPPEVEDPGLPPVGEFYDQDLDPGDPPGRD